MAVLSDGRIVSILLPRGGQLHPGDVLLSDEGEKAVVCAQDEDLICASAPNWNLFALLAYHLGNSHAQVQFQNLSLKFLPDPALERLAQHLGLKLERVKEPFEPLSGSFGSIETATQNNQHSHHGDHQTGIAQTVEEGEREGRRTEEIWAGYLDELVELTSQVGLDPESLALLNPRGPGQGSNQSEGFATCDPQAFPSNVTRKAIKASHQDALGAQIRGGHGTHSLGMRKSWDLPLEIFLKLLYLASPARPIGGFSFSSGLESFLQNGLVPDGPALEVWIGDILEFSLGPCDLPILREALRAGQAQDPCALLEVNQLALACRETEELLLEEKALGEAIVRHLEGSFDLPPWIDGELKGELGHLAAMGLWAAQLGVEKGNELYFLCAYAWSFVENLVTVAAKVLPLGQNAAQKVLASLFPKVVQAVRWGQSVDLREVGSSLPAQAIYSSWHEEGGQRMFRS
jgi:urease accessory protein